MMSAFSFISAEELEENNSSNTRIDYIVKKVREKTYVFMLQHGARCFNGDL